MNLSRQYLQRKFYGFQVVLPRKVLRSPSKPHASKGSPKNSDHDNAGYVYDQLCGTLEQNTLANNCTKAVALMKQQPSAPPIAHHIYDGKWVARSSKPHPMILVRITPLPEEHALFGHPMKDTSKLKPVTVSMVADTGCQSTIIPLKTAHSLGIQTKDLVPVKLVMRGAIKEDLGVIGAIVVDVTTTTTDSCVSSTRLLCYVSNIMEKAFLCREALTSLGVIASDFPSPTTMASNDNTATMNGYDDVTFSCPRRQKEPPPLPTNLPNGLSHTEDNVEALVVT